MHNTHIPYIYRMYIEHTQHTYMYLRLLLMWPKGLECKLHLATISNALADCIILLVSCSNSLETTNNYRAILGK